MEQRDFVAIAKDDDVPWVEASTIVTHLPPGAKLKVLSEDRAAGRIDLVVQFPPGYIEPAHRHEGFGHSVVILDGVMKVGDRSLTPGSYVFGGRELHGPMEYPEGCTVFSSRKRL